MEERKKKIAFLTKHTPSVRSVKKILPILEDTEKETRHYWMATSVMAILRWQLLDQKIKFYENGGGPYSLVVDLSEEYSCYCSGFNKFIDVQRLIPWGKPDPNFKEKRFATTLGVVHFLEKRSNGKRKGKTVNHRHAG